MIDISLLKPPLRAIPDDPAQGGTPGHVAIVPVDDTGAIDQQKLDEWASCYGQASTHPFTQIILDAVVQKDMKGQS
jgi:hypothetical protein